LDSQVWDPYGSGWEEIRVELELHTKQTARDATWIFAKKTGQYFTNPKMSGKIFGVRCYLDICYSKLGTLLGTFPYPLFVGLFEMIFLFPRWDMFVLWRVIIHPCQN